VRENYYLLRTIKDILARRQEEASARQVTGGEARKGSIPMMPTTPPPPLADSEVQDAATADSIV
jgi:hypothetical protein